MRTTSGYNWIWLPTRLAIYARDGFACIACGFVGTLREGLTLDHVVPGRDNRPANLVTLCKSCNSAKCARPLEQWRSDLVDAVLVAISAPIDRALGRALADELAPGWRDRHTAMKRRGRRSDTASAGVPF